MSKFAILIKPWGVFVKAWRLFIEQGGLKRPWGKEWRTVDAHDIKAARRKGKTARDTVAGRCERTWPSRRKRKAHSVNWFGNAGVCLNCGSGFLYEEIRIALALRTPNKPRHDSKKAATRNAKAFASTKSKDGQYPI